MSNFKYEIPEYWKWFPRSRFGLFIHWGPYSQYGRGEQVLFREHMDQIEYAKKACSWDPINYNPKEWAKIAKESGFKYACLTTRHHDGYCLWDTKYTDYSSACQAPKRDFVREYVEAFRAVGLKIGLYYSWIDWRIPACFDGPETDPEGWKSMKEYMHNQVEELLTNYGEISYFFFDGVWPRSGEELESEELVRKMRKVQPHILINNRLGYDANKHTSMDGGIGAGGSDKMGDFGTPEHHIKEDENRLWESCQVSTWRLWGYTDGERWRCADNLLDTLCECAHRGGNLLLNVGPQADGQFPKEFIERMSEVGQWLEVHGESIYDVDGGDITEFVTRGWQTTKGNNLYLIIRFWSESGELRLADLTTPVKKVTLLTTGEQLEFTQNNSEVCIKGLPRETPTKLFPVIKISCSDSPKSNQWGEERLWCGNPKRVSEWAKTRGTSVFVSGE